MFTRLAVAIGLSGVGDAIPYEDTKLTLRNRHGLTLRIEQVRLSGGRRGIPNAKNDGAVHGSSRAQQGAIWIIDPSLIADGSGNSARLAEAER